ncbi:Dynein assembly factor 3, axonemal [Rhizophlyctis rosea]|uniref:Dynein assembly factor 3, axonemal n=1 Tax=Rhizophlyctis rosea TaxID=64517 RepID=A0AAD5SC61_9FUNG|nr:Dynein assembly factor 3, axonemal [Rhizophlyctis rosea]
MCLAKSKNRANETVPQLNTPLEPLEILQIGASDVRHILKTAGRAWRHGERGLNFHVIEPQSSILARNMLLMSVILDVESELSLQDKTDLFLELYGNTLLRERTADLVRDRSSALIRVVTDEKGHLAKIFDFSNLKFRERDDLEFVFKFWRDEKKSFEVDKLWLAFSDKVPLLHKQEYLRWRMHGIAFEVRESSYSKPNRSVATVELLKQVTFEISAALVTFIERIDIQNGLSIPKWGYFSDIVTGPFFAFGQDSERKEMLKTKNGIQVNTAQEIAEYNVKSLIHEIYHKSMYSDTEAEKKEEKIVEVDDSAPPALPTAPQPPPTSFKIIYHPCDHTQTLQKKRAKLTNKFQQIYLSNAMAHHLPEVVPLLKEDGVVIVETARFMIDLNDEQIKAFGTKVMEMATEAGLQRMKIKDEPVDVEHFVFVKQR